MKSELEIQKKMDILILESQRISLQIHDLDSKIKNIPKGLVYECIRKPLIKQKEGLHVSLGLTNSRWGELQWVLNK